MSNMSHRDVPEADLRLLDRFLDGALSTDEQAAVRRRLEAEPQLRQGLQLRSQLRAGFAADRDRAFAPRGGFAERVVAAARRLPVPDTEAVAGRLVAVCQRVLLVAAAVVVAAMLWQSGLFRDRGDGRLQAAPDEAARILDALDAEIRAGATNGRK